MNKNNFNKRQKFVFKHFSNKSYSLFAALGKEVLIGVLSISTLSAAKAEGISTKVNLAKDSLGHQEVKLDEVIVTGSRAPLTALQSAKIVAVITKDDIHRAAAETINDVLKLATGVDVRQRGGFGVQTDISINGGTFDQITILLNGVNISNPQTGHNATDFPVALSDIERIEVLEGASARLYGTSAFSGAINIVTRSNIEQEAIKAKAEGGSFGTFMAEAGYEDGYKGKASDGWKWHVLTSGGYARSDGGTDNSDFKKGHFYANLQPFQSDYFDLNSQIGWSKQSYGANTFYSAKFNNQYENTSHAIFSLSGSLHNADNKWNITPTFYYNNFIDHFQLIRGEEGASKGENYHNLDVYGYSINAHLKWSAGTTAIGGEIRHEHILSTAYGDDLEAGAYKDIHGSERQYTKEGKRTNTSLFIEHNILIGGFTLSAGMLANKNTKLDGGFRFYPGIDLSFRPNDNWKFYASWNKALRMPTYTDLYTSNVAQQGDLNLKPEKNSTFKVGSRYRTKGFETLLSGFYSNGSDMIDWVYETEQSTKYHALNIGKLDNMGFSLDATLHLQEIWKESFITEIKAGYAFIHQKHETEQEIYRSLYALEYLRNKFTLSIDHHIWKRLSADWSLRWQQRMNGYHPYTKIDCKLLWDGGNYNLYVKADNLTCHRYYDLGSVKQPGLWLMAGGSININI
ncbi:MAG: TonB-dependent receptor [Prevotella sp.]|jgi:vitamin B12 transporter|nr:TonB-dependent receptor [Prevotella sp.]MCI1281964.1 TonB-dependent receptor [Prevotella sp.]